VHGNKIRGQDKKADAELALAVIKAAGDWRPQVDHHSPSPWTVARVCSLYIEHAKQRAGRGDLNAEYCEGVVRHLNLFCEYCGALDVSELKKGHLEHWLTLQKTWRSPVTQRSALTTVVTAFNYARENYDVPHSLSGIKKPPQRPRLHSLTSDEEAAIYGATDEPFCNFLFAAIHTGLRPFCELARMTSEDVIETDRGMMWKVYSSKTKKTRKIPVRSDVAELTRNLITANESDESSVLFRNSRGDPWKKVTGVGRFLKIKRALKWDSDPVRKSYSTYSCRHTFAHRMLAGYWNGGTGCSIEVLAELMGDTPKVAFDHYGREWGQHFQEPLWEAIGVGI
jgi:integrase